MSRVGLSVGLVLLPADDPYTPVAHDAPSPLVNLPWQGPSASVRFDGLTVQSSDPGCLRRAATAFAEAADKLAAALDRMPSDAA